MITNETYGTSTLPTSTVFPELSTFRGHQKNATFSGHEAIFSACCPQPCAIYNPKIEINSCHSNHSHPDHWRDTNHLSHVHASDEDQMRDATQSPQLVLGPKLLAKAAKSSQLGRLALDFDADFPYNVGSGYCWSLRNSGNWYEYPYDWYKHPFILSFILRKKIALALLNQSGWNCQWSCPWIQQHHEIRDQWQTSNTSEVSEECTVVTTFDLETFLW